VLLYDQIYVSTVGLMTPIADKMKFHLDQRRRWFHNEWLFKWHHIGREDPVEIDTFDGRSARFGGIEYSGSAVQIYWDAIVRGVRKEITEQFAWLDEQVRKYNPETTDRAITECGFQPSQSQLGETRLRKTELRAALPKTAERASTVDNVYSRVVAALVIEHHRPGDINQSGRASI
jgi:hypothetical protein